MTDENKPIELTDCAIQLENMRAERDVWKDYAERLETSLKEKTEALVEATNMVAKLQDAKEIVLEIERFAQTVRNYVLASGE